MFLLSTMGVCLILLNFMLYVMLNDDIRHNAQCQIATPIYTFIHINCLATTDTSMKSLSYATMSSHDNSMTNSQTRDILVKGLATYNMYQLSNP